MFRYYLRLAWLSIRRNPILTALMVAAIGVGIGACTTTLTVYHLMARNPIPEKSDTLYRVLVDSWDPDRPYYDGDQGAAPPFMMTHQDAIALMRSEIPTHQAAMYRTAFVVQSDNPEIAPDTYSARATYRGFFDMFGLDFIYGDSWDEAADEDGELVVVINRALNEDLFDGEDPVGRELKLSGTVFRVAGVVENWNPIPRFHDLNGKFRDSAALMVPFRAAVNLESEVNGSISCWKPEDINSFQDFLNSECVWIKFWAQLDNPEQHAAFMDFLNSYTQEQKALGRFPRPMDNRLIDVMNWLEFRKVVSEDNVVLAGLSFLFLMVCLLNTVGLLLAKFIGGASIAGIRRALGASRGALFRQHIVEISVIGLAGGLLGLGLAALGLKAVRGWFEDFEKVTQLDWSMVGIALGLALIASLAAGLYPTWRVCRIAPARYLKTQ
jgi:putative ABC transport system permease protein